MEGETASETVTAGTSLGPECWGHMTEPIAQREGKAGPGEGWGVQATPRAPRFASQVRPLGAGR